MPERGNYSSLFTNTTSVNAAVAMNQARSINQRQSIFESQQSLSTSISNSQRTMSASTPSRKRAPTRVAALEAEDSDVPNRKHSESTARPSAAERTKRDQQPKPTSLQPRHPSVQAQHRSQRTPSVQSYSSPPPQAAQSTFQDILPASPPRGARQPSHVEDLADMLARKNLRQTHTNIVMNPTSLVGGLRMRSMSRSSPPWGVGEDSTSANEMDREWTREEESIHNAKRYAGRSGAGYSGSMRTSVESSPRPRTSVIGSGIRHRNTKAKNIDQEGYRYQNPNEHGDESSDEGIGAGRRPLTRSRQADRSQREGSHFSELGDRAAETIKAVGAGAINVAKQVAGSVVDAGRSAYAQTEGRFSQTPGRERERAKREETPMSDNGLDDILEEGTERGMSVARESENGEDVHERLVGRTDRVINETASSLAEMWNFAKFALKWIGFLAVIISICYLGWRFNPNREISNTDSVQYDQAHSHQVAVLENRVRSLTEQIKKTEKGMVTRDELDHVNQLVTRGEKAIDRDHKNYDQVEKEIRDMKSSIRTLRSEMISLQDTFGPGQQELVKELKRVEMMMKDHKMDVRENMGEMKERIEKVEKEMIKMFDEKTWRDGLKRVLPEMVPFKYGRNGKVEMDPSFWSEMKVLFTEQSRSNEKVVQAEKPTWRDFVDENDEKLEKWLSDSLGRRSVYSNTVTQDRFQKMLQEELTVVKRSLKEDMERRAADGDMEVKAQLKKMKEETSRVVKNERGTLIVTEGGEDMTFAVNQLIDHALLRYSKDTIAKADYALASAGAGIVQEQTTPSATLARTGLMGALGFRGRSRDPRVALNGRNEPGFCWSFAGSQGTLGIGLSTTVAVGDITMEHVARELVPEKMLSSAAKDVEVWIFVSEADAQLAAEYIELNPDHHEGRTPPQRDTFLLSTFSYDVHSQSPIQTFPVPHAIRSLGLKTNNVIIKFASNWGGDYTCVYRIRVHGNPV